MLTDIIIALIAVIAVAIAVISFIEAKQFPDDYC